MTDDKLVLLKMHVCSEGIGDEELKKIADDCELVKCDSGESIHRANEVFDSIFLVVFGRVKQTVVDNRGDALLTRYQFAGGQIGGLAAALGEPSPINIVAEEPTVLLKLEYDKALELTKQYDKFRENYSRCIADSVRNMIMKDRRQKKPKLVCMFHQSQATRRLTPMLINRLMELGEKPCILTDQSDFQPIDGVPNRSVVEDEKTLSPQEVRRQVQLWSDSKRIFFDVDTAIDLPSATRLVEFGQKIFWCVTPKTWKDSVARLNAIVKRAPSWRDKINIVWLLDDGRPWSPHAPELDCHAKRTFKLSLDKPEKNQNGGLLNGFDRIIHQLRGVRIGLALGGGAALGMAHLGVLKVLEDNGIVVDMIVGTSAGAMTGILYSSGMEPDYNVDCFIKDLTPPWLFRQLPNGGLWYLLSKYRRGKFDPMLRKYLKDSRLEQLPIPIHSVTVDLVSGQAVVRDEGDSVHAITESINLPVLSVPINRDGRALIDGGIVNNVPANVLVSKGCNVVIAVNVTGRMKQEFASNQPDTPTSRMKRASVLMTIMRTYRVLNLNMTSVGADAADLVIQPDLTDFDAPEFTRADEMATIGKATTLEAIPEIKKLLSQVDPELFSGI